MRNQQERWNVVAMIFMATTAWSPSASAQLNPQYTAEINRILENAVSGDKPLPAFQKTIPNLELRVYRSSTNQLVHTHNVGGFRANDKIEIASATKWVTAATFMALVTDGKLKLESTTGEVLGWEGDIGKITLSQLLSFTSGLNEQFCGLDRRTTLEACTKAIYDGSRLKKLNASQFSYGIASFTVAGRMAEVATGKSWVQIFDQYMRTPLGMSADVTYWGLSGGRPTSNPRLDGGLELRVDDYAKFMEMIDDKGTYRGRRIIRADLIDQMEKSQFKYPITLVSHPATSLGNRQFEYGLGNWVECTAPRQCQNAINSSEGAFGYYPWIDRQSGYYAILAMKGKNASKRSSNTVEVLQPILKTAINSK